MQMEFFADYVNRLAADNGACADRIYGRLWPDVLVGGEDGVAAMDAIEAEMKLLIAYPYQHVWLYLRYQLERILLEGFALHFDWSDPCFSEGRANAIRARLNKIQKADPQMFEQIAQQTNKAIVDALAENCWVAACHFFQRRMTKQLVVHVVSGIFKEKLVWSCDDSRTRQILTRYATDYTAL